MQVEQLGRIGRTLFAAVIAFFGLGHFMNGTAMTGMVPGWLPGGIFWIYLTGALLILSALAIIAHRQMKWASVLLALMLFGFVFIIHVPNLMHAADDGAKQLAMANILKDAAMGAAALVIASMAKS